MEWNLFYFQRLVGVALPLLEYFAMTSNLDHFGNPAAIIDSIV